MPYDMNLNDDANYVYFQMSLDVNTLRFASYRLKDAAIFMRKVIKYTSGVALMYASKRTPIRFGIHT